mmetsp:Transcript_4396/g.11255  ORF Transcript_4396/g.11255 Transcript_4396/m.11255 type:complete len:230 (+) Transcript_4396:1008-1697(+)
MWTSPGIVRLTLDTEVSCSWVPSVSRNSGSISRTRSRSKPLTFMTCDGETCDCCDRTIGANLLMLRSRSSTRFRSASETRSILLRMMRSAKATCSTASFSAPSGFSSSKCCSTCFASTMVMIPSNWAKFFTAGSTKNVWATGAGSANPVVSMTMPSSWSVPAATRSASFFNTTTKSWRTVQHTQPFIISTSSSLACIVVFFLSRASSMPTSPNSFSMTAIFFPCSAVNM